MRQPLQSRQHMRTELAGGSPDNRVPWNDRVLEPTKDGVESHRKQEAARWAAVPDTPGDKEVSSGHSCKLHMCSTIRVDSSQETADELKQLCFCEHMANPRMIDAGIRGGKICQ